MATTDREREWVANWKRTGDILLREKFRELRSMSDQDVRDALQRILNSSDDLIASLPSRQSSGLVEQQKLFSLLRK